MSIELSKLFGALVPSPVEAEKLRQLPWIAAQTRQVKKYVSDIRAFLWVFPQAYKFFRAFSFRGLSPLTS